MTNMLQNLVRQLHDRICTTSVRKIIATAICCILSFCALAGESKVYYEALFGKANEQYANGEFESATGTYMKILDAGYESQQVYYNLGSAYFKKNDIPATILYYERALRLAPSDDDILFNLRLANQRIVDKIQPLPKLFYARWWEALVNSYPADRWATMFLLALFSGFLLLALFVISRKVVLKKLCFWSAAGILLLSLIALISNIQQMSRLSNEHEAIVFTATVTVMSAPKDGSTKLFVIHEGAKIQLLETIGDWHKISLADGNIGWLKKSDLEII